MTEESKVNWPPKKYSTPTPHGVSGYKTTGIGGGAYNESNSAGRLPTTIVPAFSGYQRQFHSTPQNLSRDFDEEEYATPTSLSEPSYGSNTFEDLYHEFRGMRQAYYRRRDRAISSIDEGPSHVGIDIAPEEEVYVPHVGINIAPEQDSYVPHVAINIPTVGRQGNVGDENGTYNQHVAIDMPTPRQVRFSGVDYLHVIDRLGYEDNENWVIDIPQSDTENPQWVINMPEDNMYFPNTVPVMNSSHTGSGVHPGHATFVQSGHQNVSSTKTPTQAYKIKNQYVDPVLSSMPPPPIPTLPLTTNPTPRLVTSQGIPLRYRVPVVQPMRS